MTPPRNQLLIAGLSAALVTAMILSGSLPTRLPDQPCPSAAEAATAAPTPTPPSAAAVPAPLEEPVPTLIFADATARPTPPAPAAEGSPTPVPDLDLLRRCEVIDALNEAERTLALTRLAWEPDYPGAVVIPSCNLLPGNQPEVVILHYTGGNLAGAIQRFLSPREASAHYIVDRSGTVYQMIPERYGAYHVNCYSRRSYCLEGCPVCTDSAGHLTEPHQRSIGVEIVNWGPVDETLFTGARYEDYQMAFGHRYWEDYPPVQVAAVKALVEDICRRWAIPLDATHIIGHSRINHKADPGPALNLFWPRYGDPPREPVWP